MSGRGECATRTLRGEPRHAGEQRVVPSVCQRIPQKLIPRRGTIRARLHRLLRWGGHQAAERFSRRGWWLGWRWWGWRGEWPRAGRWDAVRGLFGLGARQGHVVVRRVCDTEDQPQRVKIGLVPLLGAAHCHGCAAVASRRRARRRREARAQCGLLRSRAVGLGGIVEMVRQAVFACASVLHHRVAVPLQAREAVSVPCRPRWRTQARWWGRAHAGPRPLGRQQQQRHPEHRRAIRQAARGGVIAAAHASSSSLRR